MGKRTAQKDAIKDITSDSQVNSYFPYRWSPASLTFNIYFYLYLYLYTTETTINNGTPHVKSPKNHAAIGEYDELLTLVKKRKLRWYGHVSRSSGLVKTILQGTAKGKRKRSRQKKRWEDNTRAAENRTRWKGIVANSSVVPRRPSKVMG